MHALPLLVAVALPQGPCDFPALTNAGIPGAPELGVPTLVMGADAPVAGGQHGLASPAVFDWDGDGVKDLLVGEFETGPCWIRVYRNVGTNEAPRFPAEFTYAQDRYEERLAIDSW
jgi:hypothetical protein